MSKLPSVVAVVPTYNMYDQVSNLVPSLLVQNFDEVFVLDDNSRDNTVTRLSQEFGDKIQVISNKQNLGAAGNRNRIINVLTSQGYSPETIIMFIDADTELVTSKQLQAKIQQLVSAHQEVGAIGCKVLNADGTWGAFNYGPLSLWTWLRTAFLQMRAEQLYAAQPDKAQRIWEKHKNKLADWPNPLAEPKPRNVGWLVETFLLIRLGTFRRVGGYDPKLRYCEALDLGYKLESIGMVRLFDPSIVIKHLQVDNRGFRRNIEVARAILRLALARFLSAKAG